LKEKSIYCCEEHLDRGFDDLLAEFETYPIMKECDKEVCRYCLDKAKYVLEVS
jgi:CxxH/CxxC protein (TIGR04129 family)